MSDPSVESREEAAAESESGSEQSELASSSGRTALVAGLIGMMMGGGAGLFMGRQMQLATHKAANTSPSSQAVRVPTSFVAPAPTALSVAIGTLGTQASLMGSWNARVRMGSRDVAVTTGKTARVIMAEPPYRARVLAFVVKAVDVEPGETLPVEVSIEDQKLATWSLQGAWRMYSAPLRKGVVGSGPLTVGLSIPSWKSPSDEDDASPAVAVDHVYVGTPTSSNYLDLRTPGGRAALLEGFYSVEGPGCEEPWAWSEGLASTFGLLLYPTSGDYELRLHVAALDQLAPLPVEVRINDKRVGHVDTGSLGERSINVPAGTFVAGANHVELRYPRSARPSEGDSKASDDRDLAIRLFTVAAAPAAK